MLYIRRTETRTILIIPICFLLKYVRYNKQNFFKNVFSQIKQFKFNMTTKKAETKYA